MQRSIALALFVAAGIQSGQTCTYVFVFSFLLCTDQTLQPVARPKRISFGKSWDLTIRVFGFGFGVTVQVRVGVGVGVGLGLG